MTQSFEILSKLNQSSIALDTIAIIYFVWASLLSVMIVAMATIIVVRYRRLKKRKMEIEYRFKRPNDFYLDAEDDSNETSVTKRSTKKVPDGRITFIKGSSIKHDSAINKASFATSKKRKEILDIGVRSDSEI